MNHFFFIITDYLKGKVIYPPLRRAIDFLFSASITSFLFQSFYFKYQWFDITNYKGIINFFIKGDFFIPFSLFIIVHFGIFLLSLAIFSYTTSQTSNKYLKKLIKWTLKEKDIHSNLKMIKKIRQIPIPFELTEELILEVFSHIQNSVTPESLDNLKTVINTQKKYAEANFHLLFKAIICITIYFGTISHFGWLLYVLVLLLLFMGIVALWYLYLGLDLIPAAISKFFSEAIRYLNEKRGTPTEPL